MNKKVESPEVRILMALTEENGVQGTWKTCTGIEGTGLVLGTNVSVRDEAGKLIGSSSWANIDESGVSAIARRQGVNPQQAAKWLEDNQRSLCILEAKAKLNQKPEAMEVDMLKEKYSVTRAELDKNDWTLNLGKGDYDLLKKMSDEIKQKSVVKK